VIRPDSAMENKFSFLAGPGSGLYKDHWGSNGAAQSLARPEVWAVHQHAQRHKHSAPSTIPEAVLFFSVVLVRRLRMPGIVEIAVSR
jgi:hypothetical protein